MDLYEVNNPEGEARKMDPRDAREYDCSEDGRRTANPAPLETTHIG